jgi:hypothetical protein
MSKQETYVGDGSREIYVASTQAGQATSTGLSTTQTGFTLTNPAGSGKTLVVLNINIAQSVAPAAAGVFVAAANVNPVAAAVTQTTPLTVRKANLGVSGSGVGLAASAVTLPAAPVVVRPIGGGALATGGVQSVFINDEVNGALCIAPGCALSVSSITTAVTAIIGMVWEEVDEIS